MTKSETNPKFEFSKLFAGLAVSSFGDLNFEFIYMPYMV